MAVTRQKSVERLLATCEGLVSDSTHFQGKEWKLSQARLMAPSDN